MLASRDLEHLIHNRIKFLDKTIFSSLFQQYSPDDILAMFKKCSGVYEAGVRSIQNKFIMV